MYSLRVSSQLRIKNSGCETCSFFIQYGFQESPCNLL